MIGFNEKKTEKKMKKRKVNDVAKLLPSEIWTIIHFFENFSELLERRFISKAHQKFIDEKILPAYVMRIINNIPEMCVGVRREPKITYVYKFCKHSEKNTICYKKQFIPMFFGNFKRDSIWLKLKWYRKNKSLKYCQNTNSIQRPTRIQATENETTISIDDVVYTHHSQKNNRYRQNKNPEWLSSKKLVVFNCCKEKAKKKKEFYLGDFFMKKLVPKLFAEYLRYFELLEKNLASRKSNFFVIKKESERYRINQRQFINYTKWLNNIEKSYGLSKEFWMKIKEKKKSSEIIKDLSKKQIIKKYF